MNINFTTIKLIIWDLDETFWRGILSDNTVEMIPENIDLIKDTTDAGVINSICSKNDPNEVNNFLEKANISDYFVFNSINWSSKGQRIEQIIKEMALRPVNVLFVDDNHLNREEVRASCPEVMVSDVDIIPELCNYYKNIEKKDLSHNRLNQYKVLEKKRDFRAKSGSNEEFLENSNIHVEINSDCENHIARLHDLVLRSNQLNFTKIRSTEDELKCVISNPDYNCGYVSVSDNYGDYGIVGFYALKDNYLEHFVFSCRTLGMGIEQYVYKLLGSPDINITGEVVSDLNTPNPYWINNNTAKEIKERKIINNKFVVKGPCDISQIFAYIQESDNIITEFVFVNDNGVSIESGCHSTHLVENLTVEKAVRDKLCNELPFGDPHMYDTAVFDCDTKYILFSLNTDSNLGLYKEKESGALVAFGEWTNDLTNKENWEKYINKDVFVADCKFTEENLQFVSDNYDFVGRISPEDTIKNLDFVFEHINPEAILMLCLGSETPYDKNTEEAYNDRHIVHKTLNNMVRKWAKDKQNVRILDFNNYIKGQRSFTNNINHYVRPIYYQMSQEIIKIVCDTGDNTIHEKSFLQRKAINIRRFLSDIKHRND